MRLDNEANEECSIMREEQVLAVQLVPPCNYRQNISKRAIQPHKNYLIELVELIDILRWRFRTRSFHKQTSPSTLLETRETTQSYQLAPKSTTNSTKTERQ